MRDGAPEGLEIRIAPALREIDPREWNALDETANPFLRHEFLETLEATGCVGGRSGWTPCHVLAHTPGGLVGASPCYLKEHSFGEFVFDWEWAEVYRRLGLDYYPKLVVAVPFTPVTGPRLLVHPRCDRAVVAEALVAGTLALAERRGASSAHWLFSGPTDAPALERHGLLHRENCQFHWHNRGYADFEDFLAHLTSKRRKEIRRERRDAAAAGLDLRLVRGDQANTAELLAYHRLYASTYDRKWGAPSLTPEFFLRLAERMPTALMLALAFDESGEACAGAHFLAGPDTLYGRNWGCRDYHPGLHFEMCYYRAIDHCIARGLGSFEAGAQGEHKILRGLLPVLTHSYHWIGHRGVRSALAPFLARERAGIRGYAEELSAHSPFRRTDDGSQASGR